jgi:aminopeptidase C
VCSLGRRAVCGVLCAVLCSWGESSGKKGFYTMNDNWFEEHMFEIAAPLSYLSAEMQQGLSSAPVLLPAWDPMGSLATNEAAAQAAAAAAL